MSELNTNRLDKIRKRYYEISDILSSGNLDYNSKEYKDISREHSYTSEMVEKYETYLSSKKHVEEAYKMREDPEMGELANEEIEKLEPLLDTLIQELRFLLLPRDPNSGKNVIMEIRAGTGGDEAAIFVGDLFRMYSRYAETKSWKIELMSSSEGSMGGYKEIIFMITGKEVWDYIKYEGGTHRVQRVPDTESQGRIHTSAVTVAVLPEAEETDVEINPSDLRIDIYRSSGAGGQHVNTTDSAVRITHIPTGIVVAMQDERSQLQNRVKAMKILYARLKERQMEEEMAKLSQERKSQVGSGDRSERIRTYNFPQNRLTDHRINLTLYKLDYIMEGEIDELIEKLRMYEKEELVGRSGK